MIDDPDFNARWDRDLKRQLANVRADEILRDLTRLQRAWRTYQRRFTAPPPGQLDLFSDAPRPGSSTATAA